MLAGVSHGQGVGKNLSRWQWWRDVEPIVPQPAHFRFKLCNTRRRGNNCCHSYTRLSRNTGLSRLSLPTATHNNFSLSAPPPFRFEAIIHTCFSIHPAVVSIPPSLYSVPTVTDFTCVCSFLCVLFPRYYISPLSTLILLLRSIHPVSLSASTSITSRYRQVSHVPLCPSVRPLARLCEFLYVNSRPSHHQTFISVDTE